MSIGLLSVVNVLSLLQVIGFIGLGNMGLPMVRNLLQKGRKVMVYDAVEKQVQAAVNDGAISGSGVSQVASEVKTIVTMLPAG